MRGLTMKIAIVYDCFLLRNISHQHNNDCIYSDNCIDDKVTDILTGKFMCNIILRCSVFII